MYVVYLKIHRVNVILIVLICVQTVSPLWVSLLFLVAKETLASYVTMIILLDLCCVKGNWHCIKRMPNTDQLIVIVFCVLFKTCFTECNCGAYLHFVISISEIIRVHFDDVFSSATDLYADKWHLLLLHYIKFNKILNGMCKVIIIITFLLIIHYLMPTDRCITMFCIWIVCNTIVYYYIFCNDVVICVWVWDE